MQDRSIASGSPKSFPSTKRSAPIRAGTAFLLVAAVLSVGVLRPDALALEAPPVSDAASILGERVRGANYEIAGPVRSDGILQIFTVDSKYGRFVVSGRELLDRRIHELYAIAALEQLNETELFAKSLAKSATSPVKLGIDLLRNPFGTIEQTVSGVGEAFAKVKSGVSNVGSDPDSLVASAVGISTAKRQFAAELGVDPYTDFRPLADKLDEVASASALGGLAPKIAFSAIGGAAGTALSYSSSAEGVRALLRDKTPAQLMEINRDRLRKMGVSEATIQNFLENDFYTLSDRTRLVDALAGMSQVRNRAVYVDRAAAAYRRDLAYFLVRRAELIADYQRVAKGMVVEFVSVQGFPLNFLADGRALFLAPIDELAWSETPIQAVSALTEGLRSTVKTRKLELRITGRVTPAAREALTGMGWTVVEGSR